VSENILAALPVQVTAWLAYYLLLLFGRQQLERWLIARFQRRRAARVCPLVVGSLERRGAIARALAAVAALSAGMAIPLAPEIAVGKWRVPFHILGNASVSLLYVLAMGWVSAGLLALSSAPGIPRPGRWPAWRAVGMLLFSALPVFLIVLNLLLTANALHAGRESSLSLATLIALQGRWRGVRWLGILQPLAFLLWLACSAPPHPGTQMQGTFAWQVLATNWTLLTAALFVGGWQGPFVDRHAWLGFTYTAAKVGTVTFLWTWVRATFPYPDLFVQARAMWRAIVPLGALNLVLTAAIVCAT
jgi:NADH:ubiquinone oxidoreductase subunit H